MPINELYHTWFGRIGQLCVSDDNYEILLGILMSIARQSGAR